MTSVIIDFIRSTACKKAVDPFAGKGDLLKHVSVLLEICDQENDGIPYGYDIDHALCRANVWGINDSLKHIPTHNNEWLCVTNPPYLSSHTAKAKKLVDSDCYFEDNPEESDLYMIGIKRCLETFDNVIGIIPETYLLSKKFQDRLVLVNIIEENPFDDTDFPVLVACWNKEATNDFKVYKNNELVGWWNDLQKQIPTPRKSQIEIKFNQKAGKLGLIGIDSSSETNKIRFCNASEIKAEIKVSSRNLTRIEITPMPKDLSHLINISNRILEEMRIATQDVVLAAFKGNRKDGVRRRRLDFAIAKKIILKALEKHGQDELDMLFHEHGGIVYNKAVRYKRLPTGCRTIRRAFHNYKF
jgi:hypothetical protein